MGEPISGHNTLFWFEMDPVGAQGTFTELPQVTSNIDTGNTSETSEVTPHGATVDSYIVSPVMKRNEYTITGSYIHGNATQEGLRDHRNAQTLFGYRITGPTWPGGVSTSDTEIGSGYCTSFRVMGPTGAGARTFEAVFRPHGPYMIDGELFD